MLEQLNFASLVVMFRVLKMMRLQDYLGERQEVQYLFATACIAAANQCDNNMQGKPLFAKSLQKATFIAMNYAELSSQPSIHDCVLLSSDDWNK